MIQGSATCQLRLWRESTVTPGKHVGGSSSLGQSSLEPEAVSPPLERSSAMLHRRTTSSAPGGSSSAPSMGQTPNLPTNINKSYTPLRRPSQTLYNTPQSSSSAIGKARYKLPSPSPGLGAGQLYVNTAPQGNDYFPARSSIDLGDDDALYGQGTSSSRQDWIRQVRYGLERMKMGLRDGLKLDRSLGLVWR